MGSYIPKRFIFKLKKEEISFRGKGKRWLKILRSYLKLWILRRLEKIIVNIEK